MLLQPTLQRLAELRLTGMATALEEQMRMPDIESLSFEDRLGLLLDREITLREDRRLTRLLQLAKLRLSAAVEDLDFRASRGLDRSDTASLPGTGDSPVCWTISHSAGPMDPIRRSWNDCPEPICSS